MHVAELRLSQTDSARVTCDSELVAMPHDIASLGIPSLPVFVRRRR